MCLQRLNLSISLIHNSLFLGVKASGISSGGQALGQLFIKVSSHFGRGREDLEGRNETVANSYLSSPEESQVVLTSRSSCAALDFYSALANIGGLDTCNKIVLLLSP